MERKLDSTQAVPPDELDQLLRPVKTGPLLVAFLVFLALGISRFLGRQTIDERHAAVGVILVGTALIGAWHYRRSKNQLNAILRSSQLFGIAFISAAGWLAWAFASATTSALPAIEIVAALSFLVFLYFFANFWADGDTLYRTLASHADAGTITRAELFFSLSFAGKTGRILSRMRLWIGLSISASMGAALVFGKPTVAAMVTCANALGIPLVAAAFIARAYLQHKYLAGSNIVITR